MIDRSLMRSYGFVVYESKAEKTHQSFVLLIVQSRNTYLSKIWTSKP